jgi:hypothetical protein
MNLTFDETPTDVPIAGNQSVSVSPGQPWPSAYRGSRYSIVSHDEFSEGHVLKWKQRDLSIFAEPPQGLRRRMALVGKAGGFGSFRITARGEVITKVEADNYSNVDEAPVSEGWIPVYLGSMSGKIDFGSVDTDPVSPGSGVAVWKGLPFNHGERWSVSHDSGLIWTWRDYRFESAFNHTELIETYDQYRPNPGRLYVTEHGHVWVNIPHDDVMPGKRWEIKDALRSWREEAESQDDIATLRLVNRRLVATSPTEDPADGHLPIHIGHLREFDDGVVPRPIIDNEGYYAEVGQYENTWE